MPQIIIASGPVIVESGRALLNRSGQDEFWKFCGGKVGEGEADLRETASRKAKEEMGIGIEIIDQEPYVMYTEKMVDSQRTSIILVHWLAARQGEIIPGAEVKEWRWLSAGELDQENLAPNVRPVLKHFGFIK